MGIAVKRVYEPASPADGMRVLVDRLWPRGLAKSTARIDLWPRDLSPSDKLRKWYGHDPKKWPEFKRRYRAELAGHAEALRELAAQARRRRVTLLFGSKSYLQTLASHLHYRIGLYLIAFYLNPAEVAFYSIAINMTNPILQIPNAVGTVIFPKLAGGSESSTHQRTSITKMS